MLLPPNKISYAAEYVDRWMLGVLAVELVESQTPFRTTDDGGKNNKKEAIFHKIRSFKGFAAVLASPNAENRSPDYVDFVERLLQREPAERMSAAEALGHRFLRPNHSASNGNNSAASSSSNSNIIVPVSPTVAQRRQLFQSAIRNGVAVNL